MNQSWPPRNRRTHRSLVRVESINKSTVSVVVPGWNPSEKIDIPFDRIPEHVRHFIFEGLQRVIADVNIGADTKDELVFRNWRLD